MFYVCQKTSNGFITLSVFTKRKDAVSHRLAWYFLNTQVFFKILTKCPDNARENLFTLPRSLEKDKPVKKSKVRQATYTIIDLDNIEVDPTPSIFIEYKDYTKVRLASDDTYFFQTGEETLYKPVARKTRSNDSDFRKFLLTTDPLQPCIYVIRCKLNHMIYIGKTNNFLVRAKCHFTRLNNKNHENRYLQHDWRLYGKHNFSIEVIEICSESEQAKLETYYITKFGYRAYNVMGNRRS